MIRPNLAAKTRALTAAANPLPASACENDSRAVTEIAERLTILRSAEPAGWQQPDRPTRTFLKPGRPAGLGQARRITGRLAAPVLSGLAVAAVLVSLTMAGGAAPARDRAVAPSVPARPRYYVTINGLPPNAKAIVHSTRTGQALTSVSLPGDAEVATVAAAPSDREFFFAVVEPGQSTNPNTYLYPLRRSASGHWHLAARTLLIRGGKDLAGVTGIAVSPDGSKLAATVADFRGTSQIPIGEIKIFPLRGGAARVWAAPSHLADLADPAWASNTSLGFLWFDHFKTNNGHGHLATRTQERLLDTTASGHDLLSSRVLTTASGPHAFLLGSADLTHGGSQIVASAARNVPFTGTPGTAVIRLETISAATGKVIKVPATRTVHYGTVSARSQADSSLQVLGLDASGRYALVYAPRFGILSGGVFTPLKSGPGIAYAAAW
jgi:hypothetical protein